jgi:isopentenyl phosphate kinase
MDRGLEAWLTPVERALEKGMVPVLYGDVILTMEGEPAVISGDTIAWKLCQDLGCSRALFATTVERVFDRDPSRPGPKLLRI